MKSFDFKTSTYFDFEVENNDKNPKFKDSDCVRISKCKNIFEKGYVPNWSQEVFMIKMFKTLCRGHM